MVDVSAVAELLPSVAFECEVGADTVDKIIGGKIREIAVPHA